ncbi:hypothetical protein EV217_3865 [Phyllobacterium myrsinacearum]|uniref:hypothetical protein n=1 Tax=Phyllobacterium myrsinacearum TaxID=28101 RepID=UPI001028D7FC|nr:hypothetical protein [Phyllobacterium myrsinacearum]RZS79862.1 hypothetical protein EV217_3865 [Phyllobacterium myrsinacearum]
MSVSALTNIKTSSVVDPSKALFERNLNAAKASEILTGFLKSTNRSAIDLAGLKQLANNPPPGTSPEVSAAADYMLKNPKVYEAIETHDVPGADGLSGVWNFEWAAKGGLAGNPGDAISSMTAAFDKAIAKSAEITNLTTQKKVDLDSAKQRPNA